METAHSTRYALVTARFEYMQHLQTVKPSSSFFVGTKEEGQPASQREHCHAAANWRLWTAEVSGRVPKH
jgi:hypothetical protein